MSDVLNPDAFHHELDRLDGWEGTSHAGLTKTFACADEAAARRFAERVAALADEQNHHPDVAIDDNRVTIALVTHSAGGVTQLDVELARDIDPLAIDDAGA